MQFEKTHAVALAENRGWNFHTPFFVFVWNLKVGSVTDEASLFWAKRGSWLDSNKLN